MKTIQGDLLKLAKEKKFDVIVHGCNCMCTMGGGIARQIKTEFPEAFAADSRTKKGDDQKLGTCTVAKCRIEGGELTVVNAYTQFDHRGSGCKADYEAIRKCMKWIAENYRSQRIGLPKIGAGLAGGNWTIISKIIEKELEGMDVTIVEYNPKL